MLRAKTPCLRDDGKREALEEAGLIGTAALLYEKPRHRSR
jgi:hypothetical protein